MEAIMSEMLFVVGLFIALVWVVTHAVLLVMRAGGPADGRTRHDDPITAYVEENYGSHFQDDPLAINRGLRNL
jgi:hypothetical protein